MPAPPTPHRPRRTVRRQAVLQLLRRSDRFRSAQQLHLELRDVKGERVGLSTVYRILRTLAEEKVAETQRARLIRHQLTEPQRVQVAPARST
jgi:Fur family transcriptional regulator, ferric uptake regulator